MLKMILILTSLIQHKENKKRMKRKKKVKLKLKKVKTKKILALEVNKMK